MHVLLRQERIARGWTQAFVAKQAGVSNTAIQMIETGQRNPSYDVLVRLLDLFECSDPKQLFGTVTPATDETSGGQKRQTHI